MKAQVEHGRELRAKRRKEMLEQGKITQAEWERREKQAEARAPGGEHDQEAKLQAQRDKGMTAAEKKVAKKERRAQAARDKRAADRAKKLEKGEITLEEWQRRKKESTDKVEHAAQTKMNRKSEPKERKRMDV